MIYTFNVTENQHHTPAGAKRRGGADGGVAFVNILQRPNPLLFFAFYTFANK